MEIRPIAQVIPASGTMTIPVGGRYFRVIEVENPITLEIGFNGQFNGKAESVVAGDAGKCREGTPPFSELRITGGAGETVRILITDGDFWRDSSNLDVSDRASRVLGKMAARAHTCTSHVVGAASAELKAANTARSYLQIQNQDLAESVYITTDGDAAVANGTSVKIGPGQTWSPTVPPTGQVNAIRGGAADVTVNVVEAS